MKRITIVGGGITGLSAAYYAQTLAEEAGIPVQICLVEKSDRLGGKIQTLKRDGFIIEKGPDSFLSRKLPAVELAHALGLENELTGLNPEAKKTYILNRGKLHAMPQGLVMGIPTRMKPFLQTGLLSWKGKLRAGLDLILPKRSDPGDESLGLFLRRRLGAEVQKNIAEPLLSGIYAGDPQNLSIQATFPQFQALEQRHRSLILGMRKGQTKVDKDEPSKIPKVATESTFLTFKGGLSTLTEKLEEQLVQSSVHIRKELSLTSIARNEDRYRLTWSDGSSSDEDAVILALPAHMLGRLLSSFPSARYFIDMEYASVANVVLAFRKDELASTSFDGSGFLVPRSEGRAITACTWTSAKWLHTAPTDNILLRCYIGRIGEESWMTMSDEELVHIVQAEINDLMGVTAKPLFHEITRWKHAMPQYAIGHRAQISELRNDLQRHMPNVYVAGAAFDGVGLPDCIRQGKDAATQCLIDVYNKK